MVSPAAAERFLASPWLEDLDATSRQSVLNVLEEGRAREGDTLIARGTPNDRITFLIEGSVTIVRQFFEGREEIVATLNAPAVFGESSFFRTSPPLASVRATTPVWFLTLNHHAHDLLRRADLKAAEQLAVASIRVLAERFEAIDRRVVEFLNSHPDEHPKPNEWASFRARLFEDSNF